MTVTVDFGGNLWDRRLDGDRRSPYMTALVAEVERRKNARRRRHESEQSTAGRSGAPSRAAAAYLGKGTTAACPQPADVTGPAVARRPATDQQHRPQEGQ